MFHITAHPKPVHVPHHRQHVLFMSPHGCLVHPGPRAGRPRPKTRPLGLSATRVLTERRRQRFRFTHNTSTRSHTPTSAQAHPELTACICFVTPPHPPFHRPHRLTICAQLTPPTTHTHYRALRYHTHTHTTHTHTHTTLTCRTRRRPRPAGRCSASRFTCASRAL